MHDFGLNVFSSKTRKRFTDLKFWSFKRSQRINEKCDETFKFNLPPKVAQYIFKRAICTK